MILKGLAISNRIRYLGGPYYNGPKLTLAPGTLGLIGVTSLMFTIKLSHAKI